MKILRYWENRKTRKMARDWLHQARHALHTREDIAPPAALAALQRAAAELRSMLADGRDSQALQAGCQQVSQAVSYVCPPRAMGWLRENLEIALVAIVVAMAFRTYFIQPFKIPTGSMQPTLYGIHYQPQAAPGAFDRYPLNLARWLLFGEWYTEYRAQASGIVSDAYIRSDDAGTIHLTIGGHPHSLPRSLMEMYRFRPGETVMRGQILASGVRTLGDHIFVNKVHWNFFPPQRGDVMVFTTSGIPQIEQGTHYIKRLVGLPGESIGIDPPNLIVADQPVLEPEMIRRIAQRENGYAGYQWTGAEADSTRYHLNDARDRLRLQVAEYAAFGDNTGNSLDSRYWGAVPRDNLVGPAFLVYWPISARWGRIR